MSHEVVFITMSLDVIPQGANVERGKGTMDEPEAPPTFGGRLLEEEPKRGQRRNSQ